MTLAVLTTTATRDDALSLARVLVEGRLAACVQVERVESVYGWEGEVRVEEEWRLLAKTTEGRWPEVERLLKERHPYELPMIVALPVAAGSADYLAWVEREVAG